MIKTLTVSGETTRNTRIYAVVSLFLKHWKHDLETLKDSAVVSVFQLFPPKGGFRRETYHAEPLLWGWGVRV